MYRPRAEDSNAGLDTVDSALESLQFSYLDGIPFVLDPRLSSTLSAVEDHLAKAKSLLNAQPKQPAVPIPDLEHFGKLEAQVLEQLEQMETDRKEMERKRQEMIDKYQKEKEERLKAEEEAKQRKAEEELEKEKSRLEASAAESAAADVTPANENPTTSSTEDVSAASTQPAKTPDLHTAEHLASAVQKNLNVSSTNGGANEHSKSGTADTSVAGTASSPTDGELSELRSWAANDPATTSSAAIRTISNYSEFEGESDPFSRAELDTLNDLQELAAVLQTSTSANIHPTASASTGASVTAPSNSRASYHGAAAASGSNTYTTASGGANNYGANMSSQIHNVPAGATHMHPPYNFPHQQQHPPPAPPFIYGHQQYGGAPNISQNVPSTDEPKMKPSKSVGDIMSEINKSEMQQPDRSARNTAAEPEQRNLERAKKRLSSFTPPPSGSVPGQRSSADRGVSEWIPWPDLDGPPKPQSSQLDVDFENLSEDSVKKCKKLADMGFDLRRVVKVCKGLGDDEQQMINFCLLVDKMKAGELGRAESGDIEDAILLHSVNEEQSRKHMEEFLKLVDFGFPKRKIHDALIQTNLDHAKAVEKLMESVE